MVRRSTGIDNRPQMIPTWFAFVCLLALWLLRRQPHGVLTLLIVSTAFGATAAAEVVMLGGAPLTPVMFLLPFLLWHAFRVIGITALAGELRLERPGGWLGLYAAWAVFSAVVMPRAFAQQTLVFTVHRNEGLGVVLVPLAPNSTNITQSVYILAGLAFFCVIAALVRHQASARKAAFNGLIAVGVVNLIGAVLQLVEAYGGVPLGLALLRNAGYAITEGQAVGRLVRIHGLFSETSSFSAFSVPLCMAYLVCWAHGYRARWTGPLAVLTLCFLLMTTSTTAYVTLVLATTVLVIAAVAMLLRDGPARLRFGSVTALLLAVIAVVCVGLLLKPTLFEGAWHIVIEMVFNKMNSDSGRERSDWTARAWANFIETYGWGAGAGSSRGSSWPVVVFGNVGWIGALAMAVVISLVLWLGDPTAPAEQLAQHLALKAAFVAMLIGASVSGTMIDPGPAFYLIAGWAAGLAGTASTHGENVSPLQDARPSIADRGSPVTMTAQP